MPNEFFDQNTEIKQIKSPEQNFSQVKYSSPSEKIQEKASSTIVQNHSKRHRSKRLREIQTNFIKIKPIDNQHQYESESNQTNVNQFNDKIQTQINSKIQQVNLNQEEKNDQTVYKMDSPVLYKFSDDEDIQTKQQSFLQSSRRPLRQKQESINQLSPDQVQSPMKLIKSSRRQRSIQQSKNYNDKRFIKMKKENKFAQQREKTEVYQYDEQQINHGTNQVEQLSSQDYYQEEIQQNDEKNQVNMNRQPSQQSGEVSKPQLVILKSNSFTTLLNADIPKGNFVNCIIKRKRSESFFDKIVTYELYLLQDKKYLMTCVKNRMFNTTSHYEFFRERSQSHNYHKQNLYAYLNSNFTGTQFVLKTIIKNDTISQKSTAIDRSELSRINQSTSNILQTQKKVTSLFPNEGNIKKSIDQHIEKQICFISFKANLFGLAGQREVKLLKKKNKKLNQIQKFSAIKQAQQCGQNDKYYEFCSKKAIVGKNGLQLDMKSIAKMQSKKNILLQDSDSKQILIFGKVKQDIYSIAIGSPLNILEGLAFGISNLDRKFFVD